MGKEPERRHRNIEIRLTSMIDVFTILLVFLLKSFSAEGEIMHVSPDINLPLSTAQKPPLRALIVTVNRNYDIMVEGKHVAKGKEVLKSDDLVIEGLLIELARQKERTEQIAKYNPSVKFTGFVTIQGDKQIPFKLLERIMYTCGQSAYSNINLAVYQKE
jgi:biopolymer transport protein ExbD